MHRSCGEMNRYCQATEGMVCKFLSPLIKTHYSWCYISFHSIIRWIWLMQTWHAQLQRLFGPHPLTNSIMQYVGVNINTLLFSEGMCTSKNLSPTLRLQPAWPYTANQLFKEQRNCARQRVLKKYILLHYSIFTFSLSPFLFSCRPLHFSIYF